MKKKRSMKKVLAIFILQTIFLMVTAHFNEIAILAANEAPDHTQYVKAITLRQLMMLISCISVGVSSVFIFKMRPPLRKSGCTVRAGYVLLLVFSAILMLYPILRLHVYPVFAIFSSIYSELFHSQANFTYLYGALFAAMLFPTGEQSDSCEMQRSGKAENHEENESGK